MRLHCVGHGGSLDVQTLRRDHEEDEVENRIIAYDIDAHEPFSKSKAY